MAKKIAAAVRSFVLEFIVYGLLVTGYFFLVLHFLGGWLLHLFQHQRVAYALVALGLIGAQGLLFEKLTRWLLGWLRARTEEE